MYGGTNAPKGRYPYLVSVQDEFGGHKCTAVLIHPFWVLSAAHCVADNLELHIGAHSLTDTSSEGTEIRIPEATFVHEFWTGHALDGNDIVLFQLATASSKMPAKIADESVAISPDDMLTIAGWGNNGIQRNVQEILQHATEVHMVELDSCRLQADWPVATSDGGLCAIGEAQNTCQGDSGGPLILPDPNNLRSAKHDTLLGITSFGHKNCSDTRFPTYFTKVSKFHAWVEDKISKGPVVHNLNDAPPSGAVDNPDGTINESKALHRSANYTALLGPLFILAFVFFSL